MTCDFELISGDGMMDEPDEVSYARALESAVALVRSKWAVAVLASLAGGPLRLGDLLSEINDHHRQPDEQRLSHKVLAHTLKPLVEANLVENERQVDAFAAASWYRLTYHGLTFIQASRPMVKWYHRYVMPTDPEVW